MNLYQGYIKSPYLYQGHLKLYKINLCNTFKVRFRCVHLVYIPTRHMLSRIINHGKNNVPPYRPFSSRVGRFRNSHPDHDELKKSTIAQNVEHDEILSDKFENDSNFSQPPMVVSSNPKAYIKDEQITQSGILDKKYLFNGTLCKPGKAQSVHAKDGQRRRTHEDLQHFEEKYILTETQNQKFEKILMLSSDNDDSVTFVIPNLTYEKRFPKKKETSLNTITDEKKEVLSPCSEKQKMLGENKTQKRYWEQSNEPKKTGNVGVPNDSSITKKVIKKDEE